MADPHNGGQPQCESRAIHRGHRDCVRRDLHRPEPLCAPDHPLGRRAARRAAGYEPRTRPAGRETIAMTRWEYLYVTFWVDEGEVVALEINNERVDEAQANYLGIEFN